MLLGKRIRESPHKEWTTPKELGLGEQFKEIRKIFIRVCGGEGIHQGWANGWYMSAHTHICPKESSYRYICFSHGEEILNYDGSPSDAFWHEYGHILWKLPDFITNWECFSPVSVHRFNIPADKSNWRWDDHDEQWKQIMRDLGKPHINGPYVMPSIKTGQAAALINSLV